MRVTSDSNNLNGNSCYRNAMCNLELVQSS